MAGEKPAVGRPRTTWRDVVVPVVFDRWEVATRGTASAMRNAKSKILRREYDVDLEVMLAYDRLSGKHLLLVKKHRPADDWYGQLAPNDSVE